MLAASDVIVEVKGELFAMLEQLEINRGVPLVALGQMAPEFLTLK